MQSKEIENAIAKQKAHEAGLPIGRRVNPATGKVTIFLIHEQKERDVFAIDARELIAAGAATLNPIEITDGKETKKICTSKVDEFISKGFKVVGANSIDLGNGQGDGGGVVDFNKYTVPELKAFAEIANIEKANAMLKPELIEALTKAKFVPPADNGQGDGGGK